MFGFKPFAALPFAGLPASTVTVALTGVLATGNAGNNNPSESAELTNVNALGVVGSVGQSINLTLSSVSAVGQVGTVTVFTPNVTVALSGVSATGQPGSVLAVNPLPIIDFDTHDGDKLKDRFAREKALQEKRRKEVLALYERIVEGKEDIPEVVEPLKYITKQQILTSNLNFDKLIADLKNAEAIWIQHVENDDEEILLLL